MITKSRIFKFLMSFILCVLSICSIVFLPNQNTFASEKIAVTFDVDLARLQKHMQTEVIQGVGNQTVYVESGQRVEFPQFSSAINMYYSHSWECNGEIVDENDFAPTSNCTVKINWQPITYSIYYNFINNEEGEITNLRLTDTYSVEKQVVYYRPTRPHYRFLEWYSSPSCVGMCEIYTKKYDVGDKFIYAKWQAVEYAINYHTDAKNIDNPNYYTYDTPTFYLSNPTKTGHIFKGWYLDEKFVTPITKISSGTSGNLNIYPKWQLEKQQVTYILPTGEKQNLLVDYGTDAPKPQIDTNIFTILTFDKSTKNITEDTTITIKKVSIWYVYVIALVLIALSIVIAIILKKRNTKKMHKLRLIYQSNLSKGKRKIR